ncbi:MAG: hypothetical protein HY651_08245 [Acidobacteria bacterium]|nr:hypothetical protein [Acidobacteriota bacterium]
MKKLIVLLLVVVAGYIGYVLFERQNLANYGISNEHPIGTFEKLDAMLTGDMKLPKSSTSTLGNTDITPTARMFRYRDPDNPYIYLVLLLDAQDNLRGVAGWYQTPDNSPVGFFMEGHWRRTGGPRSPQFGAYTMGRLTKSLAEFTKGQAKGTWERSKEDTVPPGPTYDHIYLRME